jgi:hypothetical protein
MFPFLLPCVEIKLNLLHLLFVPAVNLTLTLQEFSENDPFLTCFPTISLTLNTDVLQFVRYVRDITVMLRLNNEIHSVQLIYL